MYESLFAKTREREWERERQIDRRGKRKKDLQNEKHNTKKNVFTMKCKNSFIINMNNYHLLRVLNAKHSVKKCLLCKPNTDARRPKKHTYRRKNHVIRIVSTMFALFSS